MQYSVTKYICTNKTKKLKFLRNVLYLSMLENLLLNALLDSF